MEFHLLSDRASQGISIWGARVGGRLYCISWDRERRELGYIASFKDQDQPRDVPPTYIPGPYHSLAEAEAGCRHHWKKAQADARQAPPQSLN